MAEALSPGFLVLHGNRLEDLRALVVDWLRSHPLAPLEDELVLVQSQGMAQWLKLALAERSGGGIAASLRMELPSQFLWEAYRAVLGAEAVPKVSPFDKDRLAWRLMRLLPELLADPAFRPLAYFLEDDADGRKRQQLAERLADLFDQYQMYRADWLADWLAGGDGRRDGRGAVQPLPESQRWQALLWRAVCAELPEGERDLSRSGLHGRFLSALAAGSMAGRLPRRILVFGISSLPQQSLEALAALGRHCQVLLAVHNPCRHYWADIIEHKELLRAARRRQKAKPGMPEVLSEEALHLHANPLLAAWGKQGRDYIRLLDEYDQGEGASGLRVDVFDEHGGDSLLHQLQQGVLDLEPLPAPEARAVVAEGDESLSFAIAHSAQREVEVLRDRLLALFDAPAQGLRTTPLRPRDVLVMLPDIEAYAPSIQAVFGQYGPEDARHIPFTLADRSLRAEAPVLAALERLLRLPESRLPVGEVLDLLEVPAFARRFGIGEADLPLLQRWLAGAGVRWGLNAGHREGLGLPAGLAQNSWDFGLKRLLLGYAQGEGEAFAGIEPYGELGGLESALLGPLAELTETLERHWAALAEPAAPAAWASRLRALLADCFLAEDEAEQELLTLVEQVLADWLEGAEAAGFGDVLPLAAVRAAWLAALEPPGPGQRFLAGAVNFCTLMPMRAIPFRVVCLLGLNDGAYPRSRPPEDFDLMGRPGQYRPGDRSRREDDRYLFLEALLSAREQLHISWVGRSVRDNSPCPPSVLVGQLRDHIAAGWRSADGGDLLEGLTVEHPLQPFSRRYFEPGRDARLFSYAREWRAAHEGGMDSAPAEALPPLAGGPALNLAELAAFLRNPVAYFFNRRLNVWFEPEAAGLDEAEPFALDALDHWRLGAELLEPLAAAGEEDREAVRAQWEARLARRGELPLAGFAAPALAELMGPVQTAAATLAAERALWAEALPAEEVLLDLGGEALEDWLPGLRRGPGGALARILASANGLRAGDSLKWPRLIQAWVEHLAGHAAGLCFTTRLSASDGVLALAPVARERALAILNELAAARRAGLCEPLPLACRTACAFLESGEAGALAAYSGGFMASGERDGNAYLARAWPDFETLTAGQAGGRDFAAWAERLYGPLLAAFMPEWERSEQE
ncbi:MAG: exodeoxyribonuclease V subunit gamma [Gammaproteobacteria bacterium]|nr:exodeoxyribonuclease V subunit gamma [Gammaproteobacteria bacterium]